MALLRDLVQGGRSFGVIVIAATQRPASTVIPTELRDIFAWRYGLRCTTTESSEMALGGGYTGLGFDCSKIVDEQEGVGYLKAEGRTPVLLKSYLLDEHEDDGDTLPSEVAVIAARVAPARAPAPEPVLVEPVLVPDADCAATVHGDACTTTSRRDGPERAHAQSVHTNGNGNGHATVAAVKRPERNGNSPAKLKRLQYEMAVEQLRRELERDPDRSTRVLGEVVGLSASKVGEWRREWGYLPFKRSA
jgi:hypothetical protein